MRISDEDLARVRARQSNILTKAEKAERAGDYQRAADLFGEAADAATGQAAVKLAQRQMTNFFRASPAKGMEMRTLKAS